MKIQEINVIKKVNFKSKYIKFALCYPNIYRAGISNYAIQLIYRLINQDKNFKCERFFFEKNKEPLSVESQTPLREFDVIGFTLQFELDYLNIINMLNNAKIPILSENRKRPLLIAGGPCALENPIPLKNIFDLFILGNIEPIFDDLIQFIEDYLRSNLKPKSKYDNIDGFYFPLKNKQIVKKTTIKDLNSSFHAIQQVIPINYKENKNLGLGKSILIECTRGCKGKCNFCLIGWQNNPYRERSFPRLKEIIDECISVNPIKKISLIGSGISYHSKLKDIVWYIANLGLNLSIPSLRADKFDEELAEALYKANLKQLTFAPETGSERLRKLINKNIKDEDILQSIQNALNYGINKFKLYFMIDLPTENNEDLVAICNLIDNIIKEGVRYRDLSISINNFIPKPHTPFQWFEISNLEIRRNKIKFLEKEIRKKRKIKVSFSDPKWGQIQTLFSRGDEKTGYLLYKTKGYGSNLGAIRRIMSEMQTSINDFNKKLNINEELPWNFIDVGINKKILTKIWNKIF
ncbi:MAG: radical SAM protein [Candidatus Helarchaeota archaeon]